MIIKHIQETDKFVVWDGFLHRQVNDKEFDTLSEAEEEMIRIEKQGDYYQSITK